MAYKRYLSISSDDPELQTFIQALNEFILETGCTESMGKGQAELDPVEVKAFEALLKTSTICYSEALPLAGAFPALVYHPGLGGSIVDNPTLLEFLASYGYVVATSSFQPEHGLCFGVDFNLDCSIKDITCIINLLCEKYAVDSARIGLLGHSYGASAVLSSAAAAQANIRAVVSLDSTREWDAEIEPLCQNIAERQRQAILSMPPLMILSMAKPTVRFSHYDMLQYGDRYYITVKHLEHNDFVTPGPMPNTRSTEEVHEPDQLVRSTSKVICECVLAFFDAYLKGDEPDSKQLKKTLQNLNQLLQTLSIQVCQAKPKPLSAPQLLELFLSQGAEVGCQKIVQWTPDIRPDTLMLVGKALRERGLYDDALLLYQTLNQQFPDFSCAYEAAGNIYQYQHKNRAKARKAYQAALETLPRDESLSDAEKAYEQRYLLEDIEALK